MQGSQSKLIKENPKPLLEGGYSLQKLMPQYQNFSDMKIKLKNDKTVAILPKTNIVENHFSLSQKLNIFIKIQYMYKMYKNSLHWLGLSDKLDKTSCVLFSD